jgi:hypothetical protein
LHEHTLNGAEDAVVDGASVLNESAVSCQLGRDEAMVMPEDGERLPRRVFLEINEHAADALGGNLAVREAQAKELPGELLGLFAGAHEKWGPGELRHKRRGYVVTRW